MSWQDIVIFIIQIMFAIALFPSILSKDKPAVATSLMNAFFLFVLTFVNYTLNLFGAMTGVFIVGILWAILAFQKFNLDKRSLRSDDLKKIK